MQRCVHARRNDDSVPPAEDRSGDLTCRQLVELVTDLLEERLDAAHRTSVERHLESCAGCAAYLQQIREIIAALGRLGAEDLPAGARAELAELFRGWRLAAGAGA